MKSLRMNVFLGFVLWSKQRTLEHWALGNEALRTYFLCIRKGIQTIFVITEQCLLRACYRNSETLRGIG